MVEKKKMRTQNRKGITLTEVVTAAGIMVIVVTAVVVVGQKGVTSSIFSNRRAQAAISYQNALSRIVADIRSSYQSGITLHESVCDTNGINCSEIRVKVPVVDSEPVAGTQYTPDGKIKYGADGDQNCYYTYRVNSTTRQLVRDTICETGSCTPVVCNSDPACNPEDGETSTSCPSQCPAGCGDLVCDFGIETCATCPGDCLNCCPDGYCNYGENCQTCSADCGTCENQEVACDNGGMSDCDSNENCLTCPSDCGACSTIPVCGDTQCTGAENCNVCYSDCEASQNCCGNGTKETVETCSNCPDDFNVPGDGVCCLDSGENCNTDPACGLCCGNNFCDFGETAATCLDDCHFGDGACQPGAPYFEHCNNEPACTTWQPGDEECCGALGETCSNSISDCGSCSNPCSGHTCDHDNQCECFETPQNCPSDCVNID